MKMNEMYPSLYFNATDLDVEKSLVIVSFQMVPMGNTGKPKPVIRFLGEDKALVLNKTNTKALAGVFGDDSDCWVGKGVVLFRDRTRFQGNIVDCLRLRVLTASETSALERHSHSQADSLAAEEAPF